VPVTDPMELNEALQMARDAGLLTSTNAAQGGEQGV